MTKAVTVPGSPLSSYVHAPAVIKTYPSPRVVEVGSVAGYEAAIENAQPGDVVEIVWPMNYDLTATPVVRVPNLTIRGHADASPDDIVIRGRGMDNANYGSVWHGIYCEQPGLRIENLTMSHFYFHAVTFSLGAASPTFDRVRFLDMGQQFIKAGNFPVNNGRVIDCEFAYTAGRPTTNHDGAGFFYGGFIDCHASVGWQILRPLCREMLPTPAEIAAATAADGAAWQHWWSPAIYFWRESADNIVEAGTFINCGRMVAFGLEDTTPVSNSGGIIRNNMGVVTPGRIGQAQIDDSDGMILAWGSPNTKILHNTMFTNGQIANCVQTRFANATGISVRGNVSDVVARSREGASLIEGDNIYSAQSSWFVNANAGNLRLNSTGAAGAGTAPRHPDVLTDIDGANRSPTTHKGAHQYV